VYLDAGFYLFLAAAALAVIASVVVVLTMSSNPGRSRRTVTPALI
jgi:hypothetical protein